MIPIKILVTGDFNAGKTTFVTTLSEVPVKSKERKLTTKTPGITKETTTVDMDYGLIQVDDEIVLQIFGTPGQARFEFMWENLARGMDGFVVMVDSSRPGTLDRTGYILDYFARLADVPFVVAANKQDCGGSLPPEYIRERLNLPGNVPVLPCIAFEPTYVRNILIALISLIRDQQV